MRLLPLLGLLVSVCAASDRMPPILDLSGRAANPAGLCLVAGDGDLALELAQGTRFHVVASEVDAQRLQALAAEADRRGWLGRRFAVAEAPCGGQVLAEASANLWLASGLSEAALVRLDAATILSQLAPHGGRALLGGVGRAAVERWIAGQEGVRLVAERDGWVAVERGPLPGSAQWTHRYYDAACNPFSPDTAFRWPIAVQWLEKPYNDGGALSLIAGGRVFIVFSTYGSMNARMPNNPELRNLLLVRDAYNGRELWRRSAKDPTAWIERRLSNLVATATACWMAEPRTRNVLELDPATGQERRSYELAAEGQEVKWIAVVEGRLYALTGPVDKDQRTGDQWRWFYRQYGKQTPYQQDLGDRIICLDLRTGTEIWRHQEPAPILHEAHVAVHQGRLYALARGVALRCLDAVSGAVVWSNARTATAWDQVASKRHDHFSHQGSLSLAGSVGVVYLPGMGGVGFDLADGKPLWEHRNAAHPLLRDGLVFSGGQGGKAPEDWYKTVRDARTGERPTTGAFSAEALKQMPNARFPFGVACGSSTQTPHFHFGSFGATFDFTRGVAAPAFLNHRNNCGAVQVVADGLAFAQAFNCRCAYGTLGQTMEIAAPARLWTRGPVPEQKRVRQGGAPSVTTPAQPSDWPTSRGNAARTGSTPVALAATARLRWQVRSTTYAVPPYETRSLDPMFQDAPPIVVGDLIYRAGCDGAVRALSLADGSVRWTSYVEGRVWQAPTYWDGRLLIGDAAGVVTCLDAASGRDLWRHRIAPVDRRLFVYGHLIGTWPITSGVTVHEGKAYAAACLKGGMGARAVCLDAANGTLVWDRHTLAADPARTPNLVGLGTAAHGRFWVRHYGFDLATGESPEPVFDNGPEASFAGVFSERVLFTGADRFWYDENDLRYASESNDGGIGLKAWQIGGKGVAALAGALNGAPAWDAEVVVAAPFRAQRKVRIGKGLQWLDDAIALWPRATVEAAIATGFAGRPNQQTAPGVKAPAPGDATEDAEAAPRVTLFAPPAWRVERQRVGGVVLTRDHVLATWAQVPDLPASAGGDRPILSHRWSISAFARTDGVEVWTLGLPGQPLAHGLAVAGDGTVVVALADGSTLAVGR